MSKTSDSLDISYLLVVLETHIDRLLDVVFGAYSHRAWLEVVEDERCLTCRGLLWLSVLAGLGVHVAVVFES